ncbi:MAG: DNA-directed RNA polymerase subunit H [Candidatus Altiarchaeota archaeon]
MIDNILVPKHEVMTPEEVEEVLVKFKASKNDLPRIKVDDPALSKLEVQKGDVIKITRKNPVIGHSLYYRVVI